MKEFRIGEIYVICGHITMVKAIREDHPYENIIIAECDEDCCPTTVFSLMCRESDFRQIIKLTKKGKIR